MAPMGYIYIPGTQMTLGLLGKALFWRVDAQKIEDKQVPGKYIYIWVFPKIGVPQNGWFISWKTL